MVGIRKHRPRRDRGGCRRKGTQAGQPLGINRDQVGYRIDKFGLHASRDT